MEVPTLPLAWVSRAVVVGCVLMEQNCVGLATNAPRDFQKEKKILCFTIGDDNYHFVCKLHSELIDVKC